MGKKNSNFIVSLRSGKTSKLKITKGKMRLGDLAKGYVDNSENEEGGVFAKDNEVNIRPKFQRANVVSQDKRWKAKLIDSVLNGLPISVMHFGFVKNRLYKYIVIDGQQRLMTLCGFINNEFPIYVGEDDKAQLFKMLPIDWQDRILNYEIPTYFCEGTEDEMCDWFETINQELAVLTQQELRNASYCSEWCEMAKRIFSSVKAKAKVTASNGIIMDKKSTYFYGNYSTGLEPNRQDVLEMALDWITLNDDIIKDYSKDTRIRVYMANHMADTNADELLNHYKSVIDWAISIFGDYIKEKCARKVEWGRLYALYHNNIYDINEVREEVGNLLMDIEVTANSAVFEYALMDKSERRVSMLVLRAFSQAEKKEMYKIQKGICPIDGKKYSLDEMETHHIVSWEEGGKTKISNGMLIAKKNHIDTHAGLLYNRNELIKLRNDMFPSYKDYDKHVA